ncbi:unnamed protein product [Parascedosporium putredinis]|uniref:Cytosolic neutral trehalase n=1 Tax=Parascedosporium putredinis TaxID=1442378 RepID=A0A9P1H635_9PEZI|nr:unnamed protein product [Parascedosporium putredinis]CAI7998365.1 unnamed protein product [Parascedosporium putredinis]
MATVPGFRRLTAALIAATAPVTTHALYTDGNITVPCDSPIYCYGDLLHEVELARPFSDSKTFVDMPGKKPLDEILAAFEKLEKPLKNDTALQDFLSEYFAEAGGELVHVAPEELATDPAFLDDLDDVVIREFVGKVIDIWPDLTRSYVGSGECDDCPDSFLPVNRTFVVAGGRFREPYYWDSYWIIEGLLRTGGDFVGISKNIIENFLDFVDQYAPLLSQMVRAYLAHTNDTDILERAIPLLIKEHEFFTTNRSVEIDAGNNKTYVLNQYNVDNNQPRPESYREDYITANNQSYYAKSGEIYPK